LDRGLQNWWNIIFHQNLMFLQYKGSWAWWTSCQVKISLCIRYMCTHLWHMTHTPQQLQEAMVSGHVLKRCSFAVAVCELHTGVWEERMLRALACDSRRNTHNLN
jgi:hypothetical protein